MENKNKVTAEEIKEVIANSLYKYNILNKYVCSYNLAESINAGYDSIVEYIDSLEVIYYEKAIELLSKHDNSLTASLGLANDLGYPISALNSKVLATLLLQENVRAEVFGSLLPELGVEL